jgi:hypothetical protein
MTYTVWKLFKLQCFRYNVFMKLLMASQNRHSFSIFHLSSFPIFGCWNILSQCPWFDVVVLVGKLFIRHKDITQNRPQKKSSAAYGLWSTWGVIKPPHPSFSPSTVESEIELCGVYPLKPELLDPHRWVMTPDCPFHFVYFTLTCPVFRI